MIDLKKVFAHLDGATFGYSDLMAEFEDAHLRNMKDLPSDFRAADFFDILFDAGFLILNHGAFEMSFDLEHNKKRLKEIEDSYK